MSEDRRAVNNLDDGKPLDMGYEFEVDHAVDAGHTMIRLVASWARTRSWRGSASRRGWGRR